jgi:hypothetical protein
MRFLRLSVAGSVLVVGALSLVVAGSTRLVNAQSDPVAGTWKLNVAKSKYDPGPAPKSTTLTLVVTADAVHVTSKGIDAEGKPTSLEYTSTADGKDSPVTGSPAYDTTSMKRVDPSTTVNTRKKAGKVVQTAKRAISADGKTMTITTTGTDEKGRKIHNVAVYEKQ